MLLVVLTLFAVWRSQAEWHYAQGWQLAPHGPEFSELENAMPAMADPLLAAAFLEIVKAQRLYPFMARFRDGPMTFVAKVAQ